MSPVRPSVHAHLFTKVQDPVLLHCFGVEHFHPTLPPASLASSVQLMPPFPMSPSTSRNGFFFILILILIPILFVFPVLSTSLGSFDFWFTGFSFACHPEPVHTRFPSLPFL
eukprot:RCo028339